MSRRDLVVVVAVVALATTVPGHSAIADEAAPYAVPDFLAVTPPLPAGSDASHAMRLDLAEALRIAVHHNLDIALERKSVTIAELNVVAAEGAFEPTVTASYGHTNVERPPQTVQEGEPGTVFSDRGDSWFVELAQRFTTGTLVDIAWSNGRDKSTAGTAVQPLNYRSFLSARVTQPVLRGFSTDLDVPRASILQAHIASARERGQLAIAMTELVERTELAYWAVLQALFQYDLAVRSAKLADDQMALTKRQIDAGTMPPSDLISAETTVAEHKLGLVTAEAAIQTSSDQLRAVLNLPREDWSRPIVPTDVPTFAPAPTSADDAFAAALKARPELAQLDLDLQSAQLAIRTAENAQLPQLDLGLEGDLTGQDDHYGGALSQVGGLDQRGWSILVNFSWTPLQRATRAATAIAHVRHDVTIAQRAQTVQRVWLEVRDAVRTQDNAERQLVAAAHFRELADKALELEQRKFLNGTSQNLFVAQRQEALANARLAELSALLGHRRATTSLLRASGKLLAARRIKLD